MGVLRSPISVLLTAAVLSVGGVVAYGFATAPKPRPVYVSWDGIGPDKWATIWLIRRHIDPEAEIRLVEVNGDTSMGIPFDVPGAEFMRHKDATTFAQVVDAKLGENASPEIRRMVEMVNEMEIRRWGIVDSSDTGLMEEGFRRMQLSFDARDAVPFSCYLAFFDRVETTLATHGGAMAKSITAPDVSACAQSGESGSARAETVYEMPVRDVLDRIAEGQKVVFVDTRERAEFEEAHIPGAVHIPLRRIDEAGQSLADADLVIPYCVKDFRGYEVARALSRQGIPDVAVLNPYGIRGWSQTGLPISGMNGTDDALEQLKVCANDPMCAHES